MPTKPMTTLELIALCRQHWDKLTDDDKAAVEYAETRTEANLPLEHTRQAAFSQACASARKASG